MKKILLLQVLFLCCFTVNNAQTKKTDSLKADSIKRATTTAPAALAIPKTTVDDRVIVDTVILYPRNEAKSKEILKDGDRIEVHVKGLKNMTLTKKPIVLVLDNFRLSYIRGNVAGDSVVNFFMSNDSERQFWETEYNTAKKSGSIWDRGVKQKASIAIATMDGSMTSTSKNVTMMIYHPIRIIYCCLIFLALLVFVFLFSRKHNFFTETYNITVPTGIEVIRPYSLSRCQIFFWTIIVSFSVVYIWMITGDLPDISSTALTLLGIGGATTFAAQLTDSVTQSNTAVTDLPEGRYKSQGFFVDILSDGGEPGVHRLQNVVFTLILGFYYLAQVVIHFRMIDFGSNLLLLMGISSGTYVGVKFIANQQNNKNDAKAANAAAAVAPAPVQPVPATPAADQATGATAGGQG